MTTRASQCGGWTVFTSIFGTVWDAVATASGAGAAFSGMVPDQGCGPAYVHEITHLTDNRQGGGLIAALFGVVIVVAVSWVAVKSFNLLTSR